jgi:nicotinamide riboside kinase
MRIAIVGSHSTGKTTLLRALAPVLGFPTISEVAREKIAESPKLPHEMRPEERAEFQADILEEQIRQEAALPAFVADRSVFDAAAYAFDTPAFAELSERAARYATASPYGKIFFLEIEFPLSGDGIRSEDETYRKAVENALRSVLENAGVPYETVRGTPEERLSRCLLRLGTQ